MRKIHKIVNIALIFTVIGVFLVNSTLYAIDLSKTTHLRNPLMGREDVDEHAIDEAGERLPVGTEALRKKVLNEVIGDFYKRLNELTDLFTEILSPLQYDDITVDRIKDLFEPGEEDIYIIVDQLRELAIRISLLSYDFEAYGILNLYHSRSPDMGFCSQINEGCLQTALQKIGLPVEVEKIMKPLQSEDQATLHTLVTIKGKGGEKIALDGASGQFIPENMRHVVVKLWKDYHDEISNAIDKTPYLDDEKMADLERNFIVRATAEIVILCKSVEIVSTDN